MKILSFAGSLGSGSVSKILVQEAARLLTDNHQISSDYLDLKEYSFPLFDSDIERSSGIPESIRQLGRRIEGANALIIASPEYNGGISSVLKTLIDWLSRLKPMPLAGKFILLMSASPSGSGGISGLWHTRVPFEALGAHVFPRMVNISRAQSAFDQNGRLTEEQSLAKLQEVLHAFVRHVERYHPIQAIPSPVKIPAIAG